MGLATGQGVAPVLMFELSPDYGKTWKGPWPVSMGAAGAYSTIVELTQFVTGPEVRCRITCSDPVFLSMSDGFVEVFPAGY